jgi:hypothetical protein
MRQSSFRNPPANQRGRQQDGAAQDVQRAPGRSTLTEKVARGGAPVQRRESPQEGPAPRTSGQLADDPAMMAAHGVQPVQKRDEDVPAPAQAEEATESRQALQTGAEARPAPTSRLGRLGEQLSTSRFDDLDASMFRVTMAGGEQVVESIVRLTDQDGSVFYAATGRVTGFEGERPIVDAYDPPVDLGDWAPRVTHVNGMMVSPEGGIDSAKSLHSSIAANLQDAAMTPDVLYTYSAKGGFFPDLIDSVKGKLGIEDAVTESQEQLILDAVRSGQRISVSAHSRGTIKTDLAVRNAHAVLRAEMAAELTGGAEADQAAEEAADMASQLAADGHPTIAPDLAAEIARQGAAEQLAGKRAWERIEAHVQLIYAGNAVKFPAPPAELVVGRSDFVSITVGTYFRLGRDIKRFEKISGGHGFDENYAATVGAWIAADMNNLPGS